MPLAMVMLGVAAASQMKREPKVREPRHSCMWQGEGGQGALRWVGGEEILGVWLARQRGYAALKAQAYCNLLN